MAGLPDVHLVESAQRLAGVRRGLDHRQLDPGAADRLQDRDAGGRGRVGHQDAGVADRLGVEADDGLAVDVLRHVGDQPVLADHEHDVLRREREPAEVRPLDLPRRHDAGITAETWCRASCSSSSRSRTSAIERPRWARKNSTCRSVPWRATSSSYSVRRCTTTARGASGHREPPPVSRASASPSTSGVRVSVVRLETSGRFSASSLRASAVRVWWPTASYAASSAACASASA